MLKKILALLAALMATVAMAAVDVNKATEAELDSVKGIGPGTSKMILAERKKGEFKSWEDFISRVKGVGDKRAENLSEAGLTVGGKSYKPASTSATAKKDELHGFSDLIGFPEFLYMVLLFWLFIAGPGKVALDALMASRLKRLD